MGGLRTGGVEGLALEVLNDVVPVLPPFLQTLALNAVEYITVFENGGFEELALLVLTGRVSRERKLDRLTSRLIDHSSILPALSHRRCPIPSSRHPGARAHNAGPSPEGTQRRYPGAGAQGR